MRWKRANKFCAAAAVVLCACAAPAQDALLHKPAPAFTRTDFEGRSISLQNFQGKVVLLNFWATWCAPCQAELPRFAAWQRQYAAQGLQVVAVSMDDEEAAPRALARKLNLNFPVLLGDEKLGTLYGGILGLPVSFLVARDGTVVERLEGEVNLPTLERHIRQLLEQK